MNTYHKINTIYKRDENGKLLIGQFSCPEFEYLANNQWIFTEKVTEEKPIIPNCCQV